MTAQAYVILPFALALAAAIVALVADMVRLPRVARSLPAALLLAAGSLGLYAGYTVTPGLAFGQFGVGGVASTVPGVAFFLSSLAVFGRPIDDRSGQQAALVVLAVVGGAAAAVSKDLVSILVGIEIAAVCAYALVTTGGSTRSSEAGFKYFVQGSVATGLFVFGTAILVGLFAPDAGLQSIADGIGERIGFSSAAVMGALALVSALAFKVGAAPFHSWAPDAYETADAPSASFMAGALKLTMVGALAVVVTPLASAGATATQPVGVLLLDVFWVVGGLALLSIVIGSTVALTTRSYRRMLGYAGVAQVGYALVALGALNPPGALLFTATYAVASTAAFMAAESFSRVDPSWDGSVQGLAGMGRKAPALSAAVTLALISLAGIPPLLGFWGKFQAFAAAIRASVALSGQGSDGFAAWLAVLVAVGIIGSVVSLGYYGAVVKTLFFTPEHPSRADEQSSERGSAGSSGIVVLALAVLLVVLGLMPLFVGMSASVKGFLLG